MVKEDAACLLALVSLAGVANVNVNIIIDIIVVIIINVVIIVVVVVVVEFVRIQLRGIENSSALHDGFRALVIAVVGAGVVVAGVVVADVVVVDIVITHVFALSFLLVTKMLVFF